MPFTRRSFFFGSLGLPALGLPIFAAKKKVETLRPGILLILVDELPAFMLGSYGNNQVHTPNLDYLAQLGMRLTNHYACAPSPVAGRSSLLTGRTPMQLGSSGAISAEDVTLAKILGGAGYQCQEGDVAAAQKFLDGQTPGKPFFFTLNCPSLRPPYDNIDQKYLDMYVAEPFDGYAPDLPAPNAAEGRDLLRTILPNVRKVAAALTALDVSVGEVLRKLRERGLNDSTVVVFTSACGGLWGRHGLWGSAEASDPPNMFQEAVNTPLIWSWPGKIPAIAHRPELVSAYDLVPSVCELLSLPVPQRNLCGRSYIPLVTIKPLPKKSPWRKSVCANLGNTGMAREDRYKFVTRNDGKGPNELYDEVVDPAERQNQADNPQFTTLHDELAGIYDQWKKQYSS